MIQYNFGTIQHDHPAMLQRKVLYIDITAAGIDALLASRKGTDGALFGQCLSGGVVDGQIDVVPVLGGRPGRLEELGGVDLALVGVIVVVPDILAGSLGLGLLFLLALLLGQSLLLLLGELLLKDLVLPGIGRVPNLELTIVEITHFFEAQLLLILGLLGPLLMPTGRHDVLLIAFEVKRLELVTVNTYYMRNNCTRQ